MVDGHEDRGDLWSAGWRPRWYLWEGRDQTYVHQAASGWVRVVLWGGGSGPTDMDGLWRQFHEPQFQPDGVVPLWESTDTELLRRVWRVYMNTGDRLTIRLGSRATKHGSGSGWGSAGTLDDQYHGRNRVGGYPDGGNGVDENLTVQAATLGFQCNGGGGSSSLLRNGSLVVVEPGEAPMPHYGPWTWDYRTGFWRLGGYTDDGANFYPGAYPGFPGDALWQWDEYSWMDTADPDYISDSFPGAALRTVADDGWGFGPPEFSGARPLGVGRWLAAAQYHTSGGSAPAGGDAQGILTPLPEDFADYPFGTICTGTYGHFLTMYWSQFTDGHQGSDGSGRSGGDARVTSCGPTQAGGGGYGGGRGGNAYRVEVGLMTLGDHRGEPLPHDQRVAQVIWFTSGHVGTRWWRDDVAKQYVADFVPDGDDPDAYYLPDYDGGEQGRAPVGMPFKTALNGGYDVVWPVQRDGDRAWGPKPYEDTPWLFGFGAAWVCPENPSSGQPGWSVGRVAAGHLAGITMDLLHGM